MNAPALGLASVQRRTVTVRLADAAVTVAYLSLVFGLLLVLFPVSFPRSILNGWQSGHLMVVMMALTTSLDACLYLRVAHLQSTKPGVLGAACLGSLPVIVVVGLSFLLHGAVVHTLSADLPNLQARVREEILAHTYLGLVSGVFLPFLAIRLIEQFKATNS
jgi:hypothetical protein